MNPFPFRRLMILCIIGLFMGIIGCSDKSFTTSYTAISDDASPQVFVPMEQGWRISYTQMFPETSQFYIENTDPVTVAGNSGITVRTTNQSTQEVSYRYRYLKGNAIFESESVSNPGRRILESPFEIGKTWNRYDTTVASDNNDDGGSTGDGGDINRSVPGSEYLTMTIVAKESVQALDGHVYGNCLKVAWQVGEYAYNYYWYAAGIGLVKYESVSNSLSASDNDALTIMNNFSQVNY